MPEYFAIKAYGPDKERLAHALMAGTVLAKKYHSQITILVPTLKNASGTILSDVLGEEFVKNMVKGKAVLLEEHPTTMRSMKTVRAHQETGIVVALWGGEPMIKILDSCSQAKAIVAISWIPEELESWIKKHMAKVLDIERAQQNAQVDVG